MDLVSIIVPIYNSSKYLKPCLESIANQTYTNIEVLLINDGSTDESGMIAENFAKRDNRFIYIKKQNSGVSKTRNLGIKQSRGKYITFVDSDDTLSKDYVNVMVSEMIKNNVEAVFCNYYLDYEKKIIQKVPRLLEGKYTIDDLSSKLIDDGTLSGFLFGSVWAALYKKSIITKYNIIFDCGIKNNEDGLFNIAYLLRSNFVYKSNEYLYIYRQYNMSSSKTVSTKIVTLASTDKLLKLYADTKKIKLFNNQMLTRRTSEIFWHILKICSKSNRQNYFEIRRDLKELLTRDIQLENYLYMDYKNLSKIKKIYLLLMKRKQYFLIYFLSRYLYPFFQSRIRH